MTKFKKAAIFFRNVYYSFPIQLLINHFKKNQILLLLWVFLFAVVSQQALMMVGAPYLFLDPEYMNSVDYRGFLIIGIATGIFIMSFHITTYILDSYRFNFLGTVSKPFTKFCLNNSIIPVLFLVVYIINIIKFQFKSGFQSNGEIFLEVISFLGGIFLILFILFAYFWSTNKDIFKELAKNLDKKLMMNRISRVNVLRKLNTAKKNKYHIEYYLDSPWKIKKAEDYNYYDKQLLLKIFDQNHLNAVIVEILVIGTIIFLGLFRESAMFQLPAAASAILLFSIFVMFTGAFSYWLRGWAITALLITLVILNLLIKNHLIDSDYQAYGVDYSGNKASYNLERLRTLSNGINYQEDYKNTLEILENWRSKFPATKKPKMIFICTSGGGQRAAVWTMRTLQYVDSSLNGQVMNHAITMTGASGGVIGASYYRELYLRKLAGEKINLYDEAYLKNISKDILNPIFFSLVVNDIFFRFQKFNYGGHSYLKDRGYAFEQQLNRNTGNILDKKLVDYREPEQKGLIPMLILSPTVVNDGRKLFISPHNMSYLTTSVSIQDMRNLKQKIRGIEFIRFYKNQDAENIRFLSALRMSATFPYITPNVELPSDPPMEIMDAGLSDNYGIKDAVNFLFVFRNWIKENTSGVVFLVIRDSEKDIEVEKKEEPSIIQKITTPIGSLYNNWDFLQDFNNDNFMDQAQAWYGGNLTVVDFQYIPKPKLWNKLKEKNISPEEVESKDKGERAALSWHLTTREKESLKRTIYENNNQASLKKLKILLDKP